MIRSFIRSTLGVVVLGACSAIAGEPNQASPGAPIPVSSNPAAQETPHMPNPALPKTAPASTPLPKRTAELKIDVHAPADAVWKALTNADELTRWFPLEAKVQPGVGGKMLTSWGPDMQFESAITIWEPNKRLRTLWCPPNTPEPDLFGVDFFLEDRGGGVTRLRLVHFGFSTDPAWDSMYDGVSRGWDFMLWGLENYLEQHLGTPRNVIYLRAKLGDMTRHQAWERLFSDQGVLAGAGVAATRPGQSFRGSAGAQELTGAVRVNLPDKDFQASVENMSGAMLRVQLDPCKGGPGEEVSVMLATFGVEPARLEAVRWHWIDRMARLFGNEYLAGKKD